MACHFYIVTDDKMASSEDDDQTPAPPPSSPERHSDGEDVWTMEKENYDYSTLDINRMPIEILTVGSLLDMDPSGDFLNALVVKKLNRKKRKKKKARVIHPLRL